MNKIQLIDAEALYYKPLAHPKMLIDGILSNGLAIMAGDSKIGKSWMVLWLCLQISRGEPIWGLPTRKTDVVYLALEDREWRVQQRMQELTDAPPENLHFGFSCGQIGAELEGQIEEALKEYHSAGLLFIDTLQMVRDNVSGKVNAYAKDSKDMASLKKIADNHGICIFVVHHTRKERDGGNIFNDMTGSTGIMGMADTVMILRKTERGGKDSGAERKGRVTLEQGVVREALTEAQQKQLSLVERLAEVLGVDVTVFSSRVEQRELGGKSRRVYVGENGSYADGAIRLDINAGKNFVEDFGSGLLATMGHELTHFIQDYAPERYAELKRFVLQRITEIRGRDTLDRLIREKQQRHEGEMSRSRAEDEVVADACEEVLTDSTAIQELAKTYPKTLRGLVDWLKDWFAKVREAMQGFDRWSEEARIMRGLEQRVREAFGALWDQGITEAVQTHDRLGSLHQGNKNTAQEGGVQKQERTFEYMKPFSEQLHDFMNKESRKAIFEKNSLLIGPTPKVLQDIGLARLPIAINQTHVGYAIDKTYSGPKEYEAGHTFNITEFSKLPEKLSDPVAVIADTSRHDLVIYVDMVNKANKQTIVPFRVNMAGRLGGNTIDLQLAKTVFGGNNASSELSAAIINDKPDSIRIYYVNKNKIPTEIEMAVRKHGQQVPSGIIHSINDPGSPVKQKIKSQPETRQFKNWFGKSKVVNDDGTPRVVYHQTAHDFWTFNTNNPVAGANDSETPNGIFFKDNDHDIGIGGTRQMAVYISVQNPLHFANREQANAWYQKHVSGYKALQDEMNAAIRPINESMERIETEMFAEETSEERYEELDAEWNEKHAEMQKIEDSYRRHLREMLNDHFIKNDSGYDGIILDYDGHRYVNGKRENVHTYIVFKNTQVKSATDNIGLFDPQNPDIRYQERSYEQPSDTELLEGVKAENVSDPAQRRLLEAFQDKARQVQALEEKLEAAKRQLHTTDRKLNTKGISGLSHEIMKALGAGDAKGKGVAKRVTAMLTESYQEALDALDKGADAMQANEIVYKGALRAAFPVPSPPCSKSTACGRSASTTFATAAPHCF